MHEAIVGRGWFFPPQRSTRGGLFALTHAGNEIEQAIGIILGTALGERVMRPLFGCRIHELVFEPNSQETAVLAARYVEEALARWEPRIRLTRVQAAPAFAGPRQTSRVTPDALNEQAMLLIEIDYVIKSTDDPRSLVYPFYLIPFEATPTPPGEPTPAPVVHSPLSATSV